MVGVVGKAIGLASVGSSTKPAGDHKNEVPLTEVGLPPSCRESPIQMVVSKPASVGTSALTKIEIVSKLTHPSELVTCTL